MVSFSVLAAWHIELFTCAVPTCKKIVKHFQIGDAQHINVIPYRLGSITQQAPVKHG